MSEDLPVERNEGQVTSIDIIEGPYVYRNHLLALGILAAAERLYAAGLTKEMLNSFLVEAIFAEGVLSGEEGESGGRNEGEQETLDSAMRTIAFDNARKIAFCFVSHASAMAASGMCRHGGHSSRFSPVGPERFVEFEQLFDILISMNQAYKNRILAFYRSQKRMPSITEVMKLCGLSSRSSAHYVVRKLVEEGTVDKDSTGRLIPAARMHDLPKVGHIRAGFAAPAEEELADTITVGEYLIRRPEASYLLEVEGDSMEGAGILEGDLVIFERGHDYKPGNIVVALTEDGYTLKYLRKKGSTYYLEAANEKYPDLYPAEGEIIGVVTSTFRKYV